MRSYISGETHCLPSSRRRREPACKYRTKADRDRDAEIEAASMTMPEMARLLLISRKEVYNILLTGRDKDQFDFIYIADRRRVTKESFERWYAGQSKYRKLCARSPPVSYTHLGREHPFGDGTKYQ